VLWLRRRSRTIIALFMSATPVIRATTATLAAKWRVWQDNAQDVAFIIGGPDGFDPVLRQGGHELLALSNLTLPHAMVRVLLVEQLYRAWSMLNNHPYHRE
jgi:23S rRNA (pseudouridine1915-N3)-methyltransferase